MSLAPELEGITFSMHFHLMATRVSVAMMLLLMYPYGSTTKCIEIAKGRGAAPCIVHHFLIVPTWLDNEPLVEIQNSQCIDSPQQATE